MDKKRVLVVDDEPGFTRLVKLYLEKTGRYEVRIESQGNLALAAAREFKPDVVLLDVVMPDRDGGDVLANLRASGELKATPVIFLTATVTRQEVAAHKGRIGGLPFLAKPVEPGQLIRTIDQALTRVPA